jgi:DNA-binding YbaB/EbfC family protein
VAQRGGMNPEMMKQIQQLQQKMVDAQRQLEETIVEASAGGGAVEVTMNARPELKAIAIKPEVVDPDDVEMLQDLIQAAMNDALEKIRANQMQQLAGLAGGLNIPGLNIPGLT